MGTRTRIKNLLLAALLRDRFVANLPCGRRTLALTFDDGPSPEYTPPVLDLLKAAGAKGTFFLTGSAASESPGIVRRILDEGHEIGNHSFRHVAFASMPLASQLGEIEQMDALLEQWDGRPWHWFRPPQGRITPRLLLGLLRRGHRLAMWSCDSLDYTNEGAARILDRFRQHPVRDGDVLLFHDDNEHTVAALAALLAQWRREGYSFRTLSDTT